VRCGEGSGGAVRGLRGKVRGLREGEGR